MGIVYQASHLFEAAARQKNKYKIHKVGYVDGYIFVDVAPVRNKNKIQKLAICCHQYPDLDLFKGDIIEFRVSSIEAKPMNSSEFRPLVGFVEKMHSYVLPLLAGGTNVRSPR